MSRPSAAVPAGRRPGACRARTVTAPSSAARPGSASGTKRSVRPASSDHDGRTPDIELEDIGHRVRPSRYAAAMPTLKGRLGEWHLDDVHDWSDRELLIRAPIDRLIGPTTKVATIGSCFASGARLDDGQGRDRRRDAPWRAVLFDGHHPPGARADRRWLAGAGRGAVWSIDGGRSIHSATTARPIRTRRRSGRARGRRCRRGRAVPRRRGRRRDPGAHRDVAQPRDRQHLPPDPASRPCSTRSAPSSIG